MDKKQLDLIRRVASVVGHELRNPLAVINNSAYFLRAKLGGDKSLDPKVDKHLRIVTSEIARVDKMLSDILAYSRPLELQKQAVDLSETIEGVIKALALPGAIKLSKKVPKSGLTVLGDGVLIAQALRCLLDNAVESVSAGGTIIVAAQRRDETVVIEVADSGAGVKPEIVPDLFEPFRTSKPRGLGLGLALARKIAQGHGGDAVGGNDAKGGARFKLTLPAGGS